MESQLRPTISYNVQSQRGLRLIFTAQGVKQVTVPPHPKINISTHTPCDDSIPASPALSWLSQEEKELLALDL
jgi:hypothetical protein